LSRDKKVPKETRPAAPALRASLASDYRSGRPLNSLCSDNAAGHPRPDSPPLGGAEGMNYAGWMLELLGRAALARVNPALLAEAKDWNNLYYSLGFTPTATKFVPKSIDVSTVFSRLQEILPTFTKELEGFAVLHMARRNEELHAGGTPFDSLKTTAWLPVYYQACLVLIESLGETLELLLGNDEAALAATIITAYKDESAKAVLKSVAAHKTVWEGKSDPERTKLSNQASTWATRQSGHRVHCPACGNDALVTGTAIAAPFQKIEDDLMVETQQYLYVGSTVSSPCRPARAVQSPLPRRAEGCRAGGVRPRCPSAASLAAGRTDSPKRGKPAGPGRRGVFLWVLSCHATRKYLARRGESRQA
jgi:hypothetical protein